MTSLFNMIPDNILVLNSKKYQLIDKPIQGGSSLVYKARLMDDISKDFYMIKEFYPYGMDITRNENGALCFPDNKVEELQERKKRVYSESKIANKLRHGKGAKNNNPWFLSYSDPIEANNTLYTVIATEAGDILSNRIDSGYFYDKSFEDVCGCMLRILDALEPLHEKGYLHLDISPDNVHFSNTKIARLIDYNSAYRLGSPLRKLGFSFKEGYSAVELLAAPEEVSYATDLFSVAAIFFELLVGRTLDKDDRSMPGFWTLTSKKGYLAGASELVVSKTNSFLRKGIARTWRNRFQSVREMRCEIEELIRLIEEGDLANRPKDPYEYFVGRESDLAQIDEILERNNYLFLEGIGGIGKTELAKVYGKYYTKKKYDIIQFVNYSNSLQETIGLMLEFQKFDATKINEYERHFGKDAVRYLFQEKMKLLKKQVMDGKRILIIVDNYRQADEPTGGVPTESDDFKEFTSGDYKVIFTSREKHKGPVIEIGNMDDETLFSMFCKYYAPLRLSEEDEPVICNMIDLVLGHTMTVMLIAVAMSESEIAPNEMLRQLQNGLDPMLRTKIRIDKEGLEDAQREQIMEQHINTLFDMTQIQQNENYTYIMTNMTIIPEAGVEKKLFYNWALYERYRSDEYDDADYTDINWLIDRRWIQERYEGRTRYVSLHGVIADVANRLFKPDSDKCSELLDSLVIATAESYDKTYEEVAISVNLVESACMRISDETVIMAYLWNRFAGLSKFLANYDAAQKGYQKCAEIREKALGLDHPMTLYAHNNVARVYHEQGLLSQAMALYKKIFSSVEELPDTEIYATFSNNIAGVYSSQKEYILALEWYHKALKAYKNVLGEDHPDVAMTTSNIANTYLNRMYYDRALEMHLEALKIKEKVHGPEHLYTASSYGNIAMVYCEQEKYDEAMEWNQKALAVYERVLGAEHPETATTYNNIGLVYANQKDYVTALEWYQKALDINEKVLGPEHPRMVNIYNNIADAYFYKGDIPEAMVWYRKT